MPVKECQDLLHLVKKPDINILARLRILSTLRNLFIFNIKLLHHFMML